MSDIETRLARLAATINYPATPDLVGGMRRRLRAPIPAPPPRRALTWQRVAVVAVVLLAVALTALALPPTREGLARLFGIHGVSVQRQPSPLPTDVTGLPLDRRNLGPQTSLAEAQQAAGITIKAPSLGTPDEVRIRAWNGVSAVSLVYNPSPSLPDPRGSGIGALVTAFRATVDRELFGKTVGPDTAVDEVRLASGIGYWIHGNPHILVVQLADGNDAVDTLRLAGDTLVWQDGDTTYRLESGLGRDRAIEVAGSMH